MGAERPSVATDEVTENPRGIVFSAGAPQDSHFVELVAPATLAEKFSPQDPHWYRKTGNRFSYPSRVEIDASPQII